LQLGDNVLAIEVHPSGRRRAPELAADVIGRRDLGIVRGPIVAEIRATSASIAVETDPGLPASLDWGSGDNLDHHLDSPAGRRHTFELASLPPRISYRVHAGATQSALYKIHTAPSAGDVIRIGVYGDVRGGHGIHRKLVDAMLGEALDLVAVTGDMVLHGSDEADWQQFFTMTGEMLAQLPYYPAVGNHDLGWDGADIARRAQEVFALPPGPTGRPDDAYWYSYDLADIHLVFLDSNAYERPEQEQWLAADLAGARGNHTRAIIAFTHDGPYARGLHRGNPRARDRYVPILAKQHVDLLIAGHDHLYQRGEAGGIRYIVSGGGGSSLYQISCGIEDKPACPADGMQKVLVEHHYITLTIDKTTIEMCPRRANGSLLEKCVRYALHS
jgi:predicted phosphodiesterase